MDSFLSKLDHIGGSHNANHQFHHSEERVGKYNVIVKQRLAEGIIIKT